MRRSLSLSGFFLGIMLGVALIWLGCGAWIELAPFSLLPPSYGRNLAAQTMLQQCGKSDVVVFGDSKARAGINPNDMQTATINVSEGGMNPAADYYRSVDLLRCKQLPRLVILSYSPLSLRQFSFGLVYSIATSEILTSGAMREIANSIESNRDWALLKYKGDDPAPAVPGLQLDFRLLLYRFDCPWFYAPSALNSLQSGVVHQWHSNQVALQSTLKGRGFAPYGLADRTGVPFIEVQMERFPPSVTMQEYSEQLVRLLVHKGIRVLVVPVPINRATYDALGPTLRAAHVADLGHLSAGGSNVTTMLPILTPWPDTMFGDTFGHPNQRGQVAVTRAVDHCVQSLLDTAAAGDPQACSLSSDAL